jgi:hypothetical protein
MYKINIADKEIKQTIKKHQPMANSSGYGYLPELNNRKDLKDGQHLGTIETEERIYDCYIVLNSGSMKSIYGQSVYALRFEGQENETDRLEKIATGKWLLGKGVISEQEALEEYGYKGD